MQCHKQPVSEDFLTGVFWEFEHVDTGEETKEQGVNAELF